MYSNKKFQKASEISDDNLEIDYICDDGDMQYRIHSKNDTYTVSCINNLWRCTCEDFIYAKEKHLGSYFCKHIIKAILYTFQNDK